MTETASCSESQKDIKAEAEASQQGFTGAQPASPRQVLGSPMRRALLKAIALTADNPANLKVRLRMSEGKFWYNLGALIQAGYAKAEEKETGSKYRYYQATQAGLDALKLVGEMTVHVA